MRWLVVAVILAACGRGAPPPSCDDIVDHMVALGMPKPDDADRAGAVKECEAAPLKVRRCELAAKTLGAFESCSDE
jgi:hypothetical protein